MNLGPYTILKLCTIAIVYDPSTPAIRWEVDPGESPETHKSANTVYVMVYATRETV